MDLIYAFLHLVFGLDISCKEAFLWLGAIIRS